MFKFPGNIASRHVVLFEPMDEIGSTACTVITKVLTLSGARVSAGWFTPLWVVIISYGVNILFHISHDLKIPFGDAVSDMELSRLSNHIALDLLVKQNASKITSHFLIDRFHDILRWLENCGHFSRRSASIPPTFVSVTLCSMLKAPVPTTVLSELAFFMAWSAFIILLSWGLTRGEQRAARRWWNV